MRNLLCQLLHAHRDRFQQRRAERRFGLHQFEEFGCTPRSLVGKVLVLDKVLEVARAAGEKRFASDIAWAELYARAVLATLKRTIVRVDIEENTVA